MIVSSGARAVIAATTSECDVVVAVLAAAHHDHPVAVWVAPDPDERARLMRAWCRIQVEYAFAYGAVDLLADHSGAAVWLDRTRPVPELTDYERRLTAGCGLPGLDMLLAEQIGSRHRFAVPHHHLTHLGADDGAHRRQRLAALLHHRLSRFDAGGAFAAAEACTDADVDLLAAHGFRPGEPYELPGGPRIQPMLRRPHPTSPPA